MAFMPGGAGYFAAAAQARDALVRLRLMEAECDPPTFRYLDAIGVGAGWRCLEVGAGAGSVVRWLSGRVGPRGRVVAVDIDPRFLGNLVGRTLRCAGVTSPAMRSNPPATTWSTRLDGELG
jgi:predicted O-methyltransferase YrrM